jgi:hypothetical protein
MTVVTHCVCLSYTYAVPYQRIVTYTNVRSVISISYQVALASYQFEGTPCRSGVLASPGVRLASVSVQLRYYTKENRSGLLILRIRVYLWVLDLRKRVIMSINRVKIRENKIRGSYDVIFGDRPNVTRIVAGWPIIAKHEILIWWNVPGLSARIEGGVWWCVDVGFFIELHIVNPEVGAVCLDGISW